VFCIFLIFLTGNLKIVLFFFLCWDLTISCRQEKGLLVKSNWNNFFYFFYLFIIFDLSHDFLPNHDSSAKAHPTQKIFRKKRKKKIISLGLVKLNFSISRFLGFLKFFLSHVMITDWWWSLRKKDRVSGTCVRTHNALEKPDAVGSTTINRNWKTIILIFNIGLDCQKICCFQSTILEYAQKSLKKHILYVLFTNQVVKSSSGSFNSSDFVTRCFLITEITFLFIFIWHDNVQSFYKVTYSVWIPWIDSNFFKLDLHWSF
jgi:hypothetical protein